VSAIASLNSNIPRYTIERSLTVNELGIFASLAYPVTAATIVANSLGQSALARLSKLFADKRIRDFERLLLKLITCGGVVGAALVFVAACWGSRLLTILYTPEYAKQGPLFMMLAWVAALNVVASFLMYALTAARQFRVQLPISLLCLLTTFVCSILWVPRLRLLGAVLALLCSVLVSITAAGIALSWALTANREAA
jgi:O-antigen/teichoic acid export membrane protein